MHRRPVISEFDELFRNETKGMTEREIAQLQMVVSLRVPEWKRHTITAKQLRTWRNVVLADAITSGRRTAPIRRVLAMQ